MTESKPSKSERKREDRARQALGVRLMELDDSELEELPIDDALREAVRDARKITSHSALRRQKQLIGKRMRGMDPAPIEAALAVRGQAVTHEKRLFAEAERWRDRIVGRGSESAAAFAELTGADSASLERLVSELASARSEAVEKRVRRDIFRFVRDALAVRDDRISR